MKSAFDIRGLEYDWLGTDVEGNVALFSTAGGGYAPEPFLRDTEAHRRAIAALLARGASTTVRFAPQLDPSCRNIWRLVAERGLFAYDSDYFGGPYRLVSAPVVPVHITAWPEIAAVACAITLRSAPFQQLQIITSDLLRLGS